MIDAHRLVGAPLLALVQSAMELRARAAAGEADVELVHDLRVAMRRLRSVLRPAAALYGGGVSGRAEEALRAWLLTTSDLRDEEVLRETLGRLDLPEPAAEALALWKVGRERRERGARARALAAVSSADPAPLAAFERRLARGPRHLLDAAQFSEEVVDRALAKLEERALTADAADVDAMHRARIAAKKLRYAAALLGGRAGGEREAAYPLVGALASIERGASRIQKRLGDLHDLDEAIVRMRRAWGLDLPIREAILRALTKKRIAVSARASRDLVSDVHALRGTFAAIGDWSPPPDALSDPLEERSDALPDADAEACDAAPGAGGLHRVEQGGRDPSA